MPPSRLIGGQELDGLLGNESPSKEADSSCWGRKKKKKKKSSQEDTVSIRTGERFALSVFIVICMSRSKELSRFLCKYKDIFAGMDHTQKTRQHV